MFSYGYRNLDAILATKTPADRPGVDIDPATINAVAAIPQSARAAMAAAYTSLPRGDDHQTKRDWREAVRRNWAAIDGAVWLDVAVDTTLSLEGLLKPIIDGLAPLLGTHPSARLEFSPNDDRVEWLRIRRQPNLPCAIILAAGSTNA